MLDFEHSTNPSNCGLFVVERKEDASGNQWFEPTEDSCNMINFPPPQTHRRGSLWSMMGQVNDEIDLEEAEEGDDENEGNQPRR